MSSATFYPAAGGDDGHWYGTVFSSSSTVATLGDGGGPYKTFFRFPGIDIPPGATVDSCVLKLWANGATSLDSCRVNLYFNDEDDAVAPTNDSEGNALSLTDPIAWNDMAHWASLSAYSSPDLKNILQDVIDRPGWESGNAVMVVVHNNASTNYAYRDAVTKDYGGYYPDEIPQLHVEWTAGSVTKQVPAKGLKVLGRDPRYGPRVPVSGLAIGVRHPAITDAIAVDVPSVRLIVQGAAPAWGLQDFAFVPSVALQVGRTWCVGHNLFCVISAGVFLPKGPALTVTGPAPTWGLSALVPSLGLFSRPFHPAYAWGIPARLRPAAQVVYRCFLGQKDPVTGEAVNLIELPVSSFQARMKKGGPSYLAVVVPGGTNHEAPISQRQASGILIVRSGYRFRDGGESLETIATADFESLRIDAGPGSDSATVSGHKQEPAGASPKQWPLTGVSYRALQANGKRRYRSAIDMFLRPGDIAMFGSEQIEVGEIVYVINSRFGSMEVVEA